MLLTNSFYAQEFLMNDESVLRNKCVLKFGKIRNSLCLFYKIFNEISLIIVLSGVQVQGVKYIN